MRMWVEELSGGVTKVALEGDLDAKGSAEIDVSFAAVTSARDKVVVDMAGVGFLASIGIRTLLSAAKTVSRRGGRMALLSPNSDVLKVLETSGVAQVMGIQADLDGALAALSS
jgi:anti-anti-sigma factor